MGFEKNDIVKFYNDNDTDNPSSARFRRFRIVAIHNNKTCDLEAVSASNIVANNIDMGKLTPVNGTE